MMNKLLALLTVMLLPLMVNAQPYYGPFTTEINGVYYRCESGREVSVSNPGQNSNSPYYSGDIIIPSEIQYNFETYKVVAIDASAFQGCSNLTSISIPESINYIGSSAFSGCSSLTSVTIPFVQTIDFLAFSDCISLTSVTINGATRIGGGAFQGCRNLTTVTINSVSTIEGSAFEGCSSLISVTIPNGVTSIYDSTFKNCRSLTSVTIPNSVNYIGTNAFSGCGSLTSVTIPNSVRSIDDYAFSWCVSLTSITIGNSVTSIGSGVFSWCGRLTSVTIGNSVTSIGSNAFEYCSGLTSITIPNGVTSIGSQAFEYCSGLTSITIPNGVTSIGSQAFEGCGLTSITIPNSVTNIGSNAFGGCSSLTSIKVEANNAKYDSRDNCNAIIETESNMLVYGCQNTTIPNSVTSIGERAFSGCSDLTSITIPNSVTTIGEGAFQSCFSLTSVTIPNSVMSIGSEAFEYCNSLASIEIDVKTPFAIDETVFNPDIYATATLIVPKGSKTAYQSTNGWKNFSNIIECGESGGASIDNPELKEGDTFTMNSIEGVDIKFKVLSIKDKTCQVGIGGDDWMNNNAIPRETAGKLTIPDVANGFTVVSIGQDAFYICDALTSVIIPNSVTSIGEGAFSGCQNLSNLNIPENVTSIGRYAFSLCKNITSFILPQGITSIEEGVFDRTGITSLPIHDNVISIGPFAFSECNSLTTVSIPNSVNIIERFAFQNCRNISMISIPSSVMTIDGNPFYGCSSLVSVNIAEGNTVYTSVSGILFNKEMTEIRCYPPGKTDNSYTIPNSVTTIGSRTFFECRNLTSITIPEGVTRINDNSFSDCGITSINIPNNVSVIEEYAFEDCENLASVIIGSGVKSIEAYAFSCKNLNSFTSYAEEVPNTNPNAFWGSRDLQLCTLYVPSGSITRYRDISPWSKFGTIQAVQILPSVYSLIYKIDGTDYKSYEIEVGANISPEAEPTKEGYTFSGWSEIPQTMPDHDVTVTGSFTVNKYKLTYMVDGAEYKSYEVEYGSTITPEAAPTKEGYIFSGWSNLPSTMPSRDVTVTGSFTKGAYTLTYIVDGETYKTVGYDFGETITPEAEPSVEGYTFSGWSEIPQTMPDHNVTVTGSFSINTYTLTYMVDGEVYKSFDLEYGAKITPEAEPTKNGYTFSGWSEIPKTMPAHDVTVTGNFTSDATQYNLTITASGNGSVSYNGNAIKNRTRTFSLDEGSNATLTFTPDKGYQIKEVKVNGSTVTISDSKYTISGIDRNITVEATFEVIPAKTYSLSITATGNGSASYSGTVIRGETSSFTVTEGTSATVSFSPDNGYRIKSVKVNGSEVSVSKNQYTISDINGDTTVEVEFEAITYTLSITATGNGSAAYNETTIRSKTSDFTLNEGASATISFTPDKGYKIKSVTVNGSKVSLSNNQYTVSNIKKNTTVEVEFEAITYTLSIMATGNGVATYDGTTIRSKTSTFTLNEGASATITFTPDEGNRIKNVKVNNAEVTISDGQYTVENITANTKVSVEFEAIPHTLTITAKGNGTASCNGKTVREETGTFEVSEGGSAVITFSPDSGHRIKSVKVNDSEVTITNYLYMIYTVQDITSDTSVEVEFESKTPTTYTLSVTATGNGAVSYNGTKVRGKTSSFKVNAGASATISFSPDKGNKVKSVSVNNSDVTSNVSDDSYTIDNIRGDTNVKVVFEVNAVYKLTYMVDGEVYKVYEVEEGAKITPEPEPKKDGYKFSGWSWIPSKMPAEDVVVTGSFIFDGVVKDDVAYAIEGDNASVTHVDNAQGEIKIEASVSINGKTYEVTTIAEGAFQGCTGLTSVEIPNSVTTIGQNAFNGCSGLLIIKIGNGVKEIGNKAFANIATNSVTTRAEDTGLKVYCEADVLPSTATDAFENSPIDKGTLIVKDEMVMVYKYAMPWNGFGSIIGITTDIRNIAIDADKAFIFDMQGNRIDNVRKGVNIIRTRDGKTKKLVVK